MSRKKFVAGNWKMYKTPSESTVLIDGLREALESGGSQVTALVDVVVCPTYTALDRVNQALKGSQIRLGAQDLHWEDQGAFTGKISHDMLLDVGVRYAIIGHSEQRTYFHETDETVNKKTKKALTTGLSPIVCVGETLDQRESGNLKDVVRAQVTGAFAGIDWRTNPCGRSAQAKRRAPRRPRRCTRSFANSSLNCTARTSPVICASCTAAA